MNPSSSDTNTGPEVPDGREEFPPTRQTLLSRLRDWEDRESWQEFFDSYWKLIYRAGRKAGLTDADIALEQFQQTLTLFRAWELLSRARLRLAEANFGLAMADVADAQALLTTVAMPVAEGEEAASLDSLQQRLTLVLTSLPDDPTTATADLELAWEQLDAVMAGLLAIDESTAP